MPKRTFTKSQEARVQKVFYSTLSITNGNERRAVCSMAVDIAPISREIGVPARTIRSVLKHGTGIDIASCRRMK